MREFAEREILPHVMEWDEASEFPAGHDQGTGQARPAGNIFPPEYGGAGMGYVEYVTAIEELSRVDGSVGIIVAAHTSLCSNHIFVAGNEAQKKKYVSKLATGEFIGAWGLTEPSSGSDAGSARMSATKAKGGWVLNGTKTFCTNGHYADVLVVLAVTDRAAHTHGLSAFIVEKGRQGISSGKERKQARASRQRHSRTDFRRLLCLRPRTCWAAKGTVSSTPCASSTADASRLRRSRWAWPRERTKPRSSIRSSVNSSVKAISEFQAIQWKLADMATEIEAAKLLTLRAAAMKDAGMKTTLESSMAKLYASEVAVRCANEGVQIHGGYGFIKDYPAEKFYRDVKLCTIGEGTSEIQRLVIARQLLKD